MKKRPNKGGRTYNHSAVKVCGESGLPSSATSHHPQNLSKKTVVAAATLQHWSGPLPPPSSLAAYEGIIRGSAERLLAIWEKEENFQQDMGRQSLKMERERRILGAGLSVFFGLAALAESYFIGDSFLAIALASYPVAGIINRVFRRSND